MDFPSDVAGVALIDSASPYQFDLPAYPRFYSAWRRLSAILPSLARTGAARLFNSIGSRSLPPAAERAARGLSAAPRELCANQPALQRWCRSAVAA